MALMSPTWTCNFFLAQIDLLQWANSAAVSWDRPAVETSRIIDGTRVCSITVPPDHGFRGSMQALSFTTWVNIGTMWTSHFSTINRGIRALRRQIKFQSEQIGRASC